MIKANKDELTKYEALTSVWKYIKKSYKPKIHKVHSTEYPV